MSPVEFSLEQPVPLHGGTGELIAPPHRCCHFFFPRAPSASLCWKRKGGGRLFPRHPLRAKLANGPRAMLAELQVCKSAIDQTSFNPADRLAYETPDAIMATWS